MPRVVATAEMIHFVEWRGHIPDDVPEDEWMNWVKEHIDGGDFNDTGEGDWVWIDVRR